ncbi:hypothetical protein LJC15_03450 [Desulfovibrio sp. OttesenSCG-928-G11]|nr:hypothetical protein [Desulfovibrio sp. OttesenSCG-928-G11]
MRLRLLFQIALCILFLSLASVPALAWDSKDFSGDDSARLMSVMDNLAYIADGDDNGRHLYVLFSPDCSASKAFYDVALKNPGKVQIRWIPVDPSGDLNSMFEEAGTDILKDAFVKSEIPGDVDPGRTAAIARYNNAALFWLCLCEMIAPDSNLAFPTFVYGSKDKASVFIGMNSDINFDKFIAPVPDTGATALPDALRFAGESIDLSPTPQIKEYAPGSESKTVRAFPAPDAVKLGSVKANTTLPVPVVGVTKNGYLAIDMLGTKTYLFIEDEAAAQAALAKK